MIHRLVRLLALATFVLGCSIATVDHKLGEAAPLDFGHTANFAGGLAVTFTRLVSDSRCPADVTCIQAGEAVVELACAHKGQTQTIQVSSDRRKNRAEVFGYVVELMSVSPHSTQHSRAQKEFSVTLRVTER